MADTVNAMNHCHIVFYYCRELQLNVTMPVLVICNLPLGPSPRRHTVLAFVISALLGFVQLRTAGNELSPFQAYPATTRASVISILGYYSSFGAKLWFPRFASKLSFAMAVFGSISVASLVTLLLPLRWWRMSCILYIVLLGAEFKHFIRNMYDRFVQRSSDRSTAATSLLPQTIIHLMNNSGYVHNSMDEIYVNSP